MLSLRLRRRHRPRRYSSSRAPGLEAAVGRLAGAWLWNVSYTAPFGTHGGQERDMNLTFAVERLLETGWTALGEPSVEHLPDGRPFPTVAAVRSEFERAGLRLELK